MKREDKHLQDDNDFRQLMATKPGRRFMYDMLQDCRVFHQSFSVDDRNTNFNEGARSIGLKLMARINELCPTEYALMMQEHPDNIIDQDEANDDG